METQKFGVHITVSLKPQEIVLTMSTKLKYCPLQIRPFWRIQKYPFIKMIICLNPIHKASTRPK